MKALLLTLALFAGFVPALATEHTIAQAEADAVNVKTLVLNGSKNESQRLLKLAPKLLALETVVLDGISADETAFNLVSSIAACNKARAINFRNCALTTLPANLRMLTQINAFTSEKTAVTDGEQFYNAIADMANVKSVAVSGSDFRSLPKSFSRLRVMDKIDLVNTDLQLASGYDLNTKTADELRATESVQFGFGDDALVLNYTCYNTAAAKSHMQMFRDVLQGAYRQSNVFYTPNENKTFQKKHPLVKPPVKGVDIAPDVFTVNAMTGSVVEYGSGTRIAVPSMAFEDANGTPVQGQVDITYREFRDPVDIVLSGIPMTYDSAGISGDFKSAGMFEMQASQNGSEVFLREGKNVDMKFAVTDTSAAYDFYRLDEKKGWVYLSDPGKAETDASSTEEAIATTRNPGDAKRTQRINDYAFRDSAGNVVVSDSAPWVGTDPTSAVRLYWDNIRGVQVKNWIKDTTPLARRYEDTCYFGNHRCVFPDREEDDRSWAQKRRLSSCLYFKKRASGKEYTVISIENVADRWGANPELAAYSGYLWKIDQKFTTKQISERFGKKSGINDCRIEQNGSDYYIELKYHWGYDRIKAEPVKLDRDGKPKAFSDDKKEKLFEQYTKRLNNRSAAVDRNNAKQVQYQATRVQRAHNDSVRVWKGLNKMMTGEEKKMDFPAWRQYVKDTRLNMYANVLNAKTSGEDAAYQALSISGMGVYNCDQISRMQKPKEFVAKTITAAGAVIVPVALFVIDKVKNMVFRYGGGWSEGMGQGPKGVDGHYDDNAKMQMLATDKEGNLYMITEEQFEAAKAENDKHMEFHGTRISDGETTPESVRQAVFPEQ